MLRPSGCQVSYRKDFSGGKSFPVSPANINKVVCGFFYAVLLIFILLQNSFREVDAWFLDM